MKRSEFYVALSRVPRLDKLLLFGDVHQLLDRLPPWPKSIKNYVRDERWAKHRSFFQHPLVTRWIPFMSASELAEEFKLDL